MGLERGDVRVAAVVGVSRRGMMFGGRGNGVDGCEDQVPCDGMTDLRASATDDMVGRERLTSSLSHTALLARKVRVVKGRVYVKKDLMLIVAALSATRAPVGCVWPWSYKGM